MMTLSLEADDTLSWLARHAARALLGESPVTSGRNVATLADNLRQCLEEQ